MKKIYCTTYEFKKNILILFYIGVKLEFKKCIIMIHFEKTLVVY